MPPKLALAIAIAAEVAGTTALKASNGFSRPLPGAITAAGYALAFWCLAQALRTIPVGVAYAIWSGVGIVLVAVIGRVAFGQRLDAAALAGMALIVAGVLVINTLSGASGS